MAPTTPSAACAWAAAAPAAKGPPAGTKTLSSSLWEWGHGTRTLIGACASAHSKQLPAAHACSASPSCPCQVPRTSATLAHLEPHHARTANCNVFSVLTWLCSRVNIVLARHHSIPKRTHVRKQQRHLRHVLGRGVRKHMRRVAHGKMHLNHDLLRQRHAGQQVPQQRGLMALLGQGKKSGVRVCVQAVGGMA